MSMALKEMGCNMDYASDQSIIYLVTNGEIAERNITSLKKTCIFRIFVPHADSSQITRFKQL